MIDRIIEGRHPRMLERIDELAASGKTDLFVVGALHFFGPDGLLEALGARLPVRAALAGNAPSSI